LDFGFFIFGLRAGPLSQENLEKFGILGIGKRNKKIICHPVGVNIFWTSAWTFLFDFDRQRGQSSLISSQRNLEEKYLKKKPHTCRFSGY